MEITDEGFIGLLKKGDSDAFEKMFVEYFPGIRAYAFAIIHDHSLADEVVQNVFYKIWSKKEKLQIISSLKAYLYKSVYHECLDQLRKSKRIKLLRSQSVQNNRNLVAQESAQGKAEMHELENKIQQAIRALPPECRAIFYLSRFEELKYQEIALRMELSVKTVEAQMGKALKRLRIALKEFLPLLIFISWML